MRGTERNQILKTNQKQRSLGPSVIHSRLSNQERELSIFRGFIFFVLCCVFFPNVCLCLSVKIQTWFQLACGLLWGPGLPELNTVSLTHKWLNTTNTTWEKHVLGVRMRYNEGKIMTFVLWPQTIQGTTYTPYQRNTVDVLKGQE